LRLARGIFFVQRLVRAKNRNDGLFEPRQLLQGIPLVGLVGRGEVRVDAFQRHAGVFLQRFGQQARLPRQQARAAHARVDLQVDPRGLPHASGDGGQHLDLLARDGRQAHVAGDEFLQGVADGGLAPKRAGREERQQRLGTAKVADGDGLFGRRNREVVAKGADGIKQQVQPVAIAVGLDDGAELSGRLEQTSQQPQVVGHRGGRDFGAKVTFHSSLRK
jgi:hypothetical protein